MNGICPAILPSGVSKCKKLLGDVKYIMIDKVDVTLTADEAVSEFKNLALTREPVSNEIQSHLLKILTPEVTTDDANVVTFANTRKHTTNKPIPSGVFYAESSYSDSIELLKVFNGDTYRIRMFTDDGIQILTFNPSTLKYAGFKAGITATTKGIPQDADPDKLVKLEIQFTSYEEFENSVTVKPEWNISTSILDNLPNGLTIRPTSLYTNTTGEIDVQINERDGNDFTGLVSDDIISLSSNRLSDIAIIATDNGNGSYTLAVTKDAAPVNLAIGDRLVIQVQNKTGNVVDYISNQLYFEVLS